MACDVNGAAIACLMTTQLDGAIPGMDALRYSSPNIKNLSYALDNVHADEVTFPLSTEETFAFFPLGPIPNGIVWEYDWDIPEFPPQDQVEENPLENSYWDGYEITQQGPILLIKIREGNVHYSTPEWIATLTGTLYCDGNLIATAILRLGIKSFE